MASQKFDKEFLKKHREDLVDTIRENNKLLDTQQIELARGGLIASLVIVQYFFPYLSNTVFKWLLFLGWGGLIIALVLNTVSYRMGMKVNLKTIEDIDNGDYDSNIENKRFNRIGIYDDSVFALIIISIVSIFIFISINLLQMSKKPEVNKPAIEEAKNVQKINAEKSIRVVPATTSTGTSKPSTGGKKS